MFASQYHNSTLHPSQESAKSSDELMQLFSHFASKYLPQVNQTNLQDIDEDDPLSVEFGGFDIALQLMYASYVGMRDQLQNVLQHSNTSKKKKRKLDDFNHADLVTSTPRPSASETLKNLFPAIPTESEAVVMNKDVTADPSYVPETMELIHNHAKPESKGQMVPDTMAIEDNVEATSIPERITSPVFGSSPVPARRKSPIKKSKVSRKRQSFEDVFEDCNRVFASEAKRKQEEEDEKDKDALIRMKYVPLACITNEGDPGTTGAPTVESDLESPSILHKKLAKQSKLQANDTADTSMDDFKDVFDEPVAKASKDKSPQKKKQKRSYKVEYDEFTFSQAERNRIKQQNMKQKKLDNFLKPKDVNVRKQETKAPDHDEDLKKAIELSKKVFQEETEKKILKDLDHNREDTFNELPKQDDEDEAFKYVGDTVRKKADRLKLIAFDCPDCKNFYQNENLTEDQIRELLSKCSRHRAKFMPRNVSPQKRWEVDFSQEPPLETQKGSPLKSRKEYWNNPRT